MTRRTLMRWALSIVAALPFRSVRLFAQSRGLAESDVSTLRELASAALPSSLDRRATEAVVTQFVTWLRDYKAGVEMSHGYGVPRLRSTPEMDTRRYALQLRELTSSARQQGAELDELPGDAVRRLIRLSLEEAGVSQLPDRPNGVHVVADLMSFYLRSSEANDLCYDAEIRRYKCPGLAGMTERPAKMGAGRGRA